MACSLKDCPSPEAMAATTVGSVSCVAAVDASSVTSWFMLFSLSWTPNPGTTACLTPSGQDGRQAAAKIGTRKPEGRISGAVTGRKQIAMGEYVPLGFPEQARVGSLISAARMVP